MKRSWVFVLVLALSFTLPLGSSYADEENYCGPENPGIRRLARMINEIPDGERREVIALLTQTLREMTQDQKVNLEDSPEPMVSALRLATTKVSRETTSVKDESYIGGQ